MKRYVSTLLALSTIALGSLVGLSPAAHAYAYCERYTQGPSFYGDVIDAYYYVSCSRSVPRATLYGRLKEDRPSLPDTDLKYDQVTFTGTKGDHVTVASCQNNDAIYSEAKINNEASTQSSRNLMHC